MGKVNPVSVGSTIFLILIPILFYTGKRELSYSKHFSFHSLNEVTNSTHKCVPIPLPLPPKHRDTKELWTKLHALFEEHTPAQRSKPIAFPGGIVDNPPFNVLDEYLPIERIDAIDMRMTHGHLVKSLPDLPNKLFRGQGIVMVTDSIKGEFAATSLGMLRLLGSRLPVELWMLDRALARKRWCEELAHQGVACRYLEDYVDNAQKVSGDENQQVAAAMLFSSFEEILYLDSTTIPVAKPDDVFEAEGFEDTGCVLWSDFWRSTESPWTAYITGVSQQKDTRRSEQQAVDAAQMVWHKGLQWKVRTPESYLSIGGLVHPTSNHVFSHVSRFGSTSGMCFYHYA